MLDKGMQKFGSLAMTALAWPTRFCWITRWQRWGAGLPPAVMAKLLDPQRRVMAVCGDGGFLMNSQELETTVRLGLDLVVLILEDNAYGMIRWKQAAVFDLWQSGLREIRRVVRSQRLAGARQGGYSRRWRRPFSAGGVHGSRYQSTTLKNMRVLVDELTNRVPTFGPAQ